MHIQEASDDYDYLTIILKVGSPTIEGSFMFPVSLRFFYNRIEQHVLDTNAGKQLS